MSTQEQTAVHKLGPANGTLRVKTTRAGMASAAGHDLTLEVGQWDAEIDASNGWENASMSFSADPNSLTVVSGEGGVKPLNDKDKGDIKKNISEKVLKGGAISFRSTGVQGDANSMHVDGELTMNGSGKPVSFQMSAGDKITATAKVKQSDFGIKPYSAMMGALKVADPVTIELEASL